MSRDKKDLVIITTVVYTKLPSVFSPNERYEQLLESIRSVVSNIPNPYIVVIEGSKLCKEMIKEVKDMGANFHECSVLNLDKQYGELELILSFFSSVMWEDITSMYQIEKIHKLSGRYVLDKDYEYPSYDDICLCKLLLNSTWSGYPICITRYYCFPFIDIDQYLKAIKDIKMDGIFIDIEHSFHRYNALPFQKMLKTNTSNLHVSGSIAPNGERVQD